MNGIPAEAFEFYEQLATDNTKEFWTEHKATYDMVVRQPMQQLADALEPAFGQGRLYRPYRDMRFSRDKTPYKDHQGLVFAAENGLGWYVQISAAGLMVAGGWYSGTPSQVRRFREAILDGAGSELAGYVGALTKSGFEMGGDTLKTRPRGVDADHPYVDLLRHRTLHATKMWEPAAWMGTKRLHTTVRANFDKLTRFNDYLANLVGPPDPR